MHLYAYAYGGGGGELPSELFKCQYMYSGKTKLIFGQEHPVFGHSVFLLFSFFFACGSKGAQQAPPPPKNGSTMFF